MRSLGILIIRWVCLHWVISRKKALKEFMLVQCVQGSWVMQQSGLSLSHKNVAKQTLEQYKAGSRSYPACDSAIVTLSVPGTSNCQLPRTSYQTNMSLGKLRYKVEWKIVIFITECTLDPLWDCQSKVTCDGGSVPEFTQERYSRSIGSICPCLPDARNSCRAQDKSGQERAEPNI